MNIDCEKVKVLFNKIENGYSVSEIKNIGRSWLSRDIKCAVTGHGQKNILVVGGVGGKDIKITSFLVGFSHELDNAAFSNGRISDFNISALCSKSKIHIVPLLNPDGIILNNCGISQDNPFYGRVHNMMKGETDFTNWDANIRGVSLYGNFRSDWLKLKLTERTNRIFMNSPAGYFGEYPESELETSSLCSFSKRGDFHIVFELRRAEHFFIKPIEVDESKNKIKAVTRVINEYTNIKISDENFCVNGTFALWTATEYQSLSFIIGVPDNMTPENYSALKNAVLLASAV